MLIYIPIPEKFVFIARACMYVNHVLLLLNADTTRFHGPNPLLV